MIKFIKSLFAPAVTVESPVVGGTIVPGTSKLTLPVSEVVTANQPAKKTAAKKPVVKKATTRKPKAK